ncbi:MAG: HAF repeat-containing protein [Phycisphaerae bacterium]|nr:HAF repeat-containing protein [Phycisphaerae bacterium]
MIRKRVLKRALVVVATGLLITPAGLVCMSEDIDLGTLGGTESIAAALDDAGHVVGGAETASGQWHAFLWSESGGMTDLGTLGGPDSEGHDVTTADGLTIVGTSDMPHPLDANQSVERAFVWFAGIMTELGTLGGDSSEAWAISDTGKIVGASETIEGDWHAFLWQSLSMTDLGTLGGDNSFAYGVNSAGLVVGWSTAPSPPDQDPNNPEPAPVKRAFLWTEAGGMTDLGTLGGRNSAAYAVNEAGYVTGWSDTPEGERHVCVWDPNGAMQDLGTPGGPVAEAWGLGPGSFVGYGLDPNGQLDGIWSGGTVQVWSIGQPLGGNGPVFVYDIGGALLNKVGSAVTPTGEMHAFLRQNQPPMP